MNQEQLDKEITKLKLEYDVDAYNSQIKQAKCKLLELEKQAIIHKQKIAELSEKILNIQVLIEENGK